MGLKGFRLVCRSNHGGARYWWDRAVERLVSVMERKADDKDEIRGRKATNGEWSLESSVKELAEG